MSPINLRVHVEPLRIQFLCVDDGPERLLHTLAVLMEVVDLDLNGRFIPRAEDFPDILFIGDALLVGKQINGFQHLFFNAANTQVLNGDIGVFHHVVKETNLLLQFCLTHQADGKDMKDCRVALQVLLSVVRFERNTYGLRLS